MTGSETSPLLDQLSHGYRIDRKFGLVFDSAPLGSDDLTLIRGIDTREAVLLNRLGIYQLAQIALWERREIPAFADELGMTVSALLGEKWIEQARELCADPESRPIAATSPPEVLPASFVRTATLLVFATMIGCCVVYWLNLQRDHSFRGILSAEITSLRVPSEARLLTAHVEAGDEVFTGQPLLTLEKTEHLAMIRTQEKRVHELRQDLQRAEAQASLDLEWRVREVESEIVEMQTRAHLIQEVERDAPELLRSVSLTHEHPFSAEDAEVAFDDDSPEAVAAETVSVTQEVVRTKGPNNYVFFAASGARSPLPEVDPPAAVPVPVTTTARKTSTDVRPPTRVAMTTESSRSPVLRLEAQTVQQRLARLEELRAMLPEQVRRAAGVETLRSQLTETENRLKEMQEVSREVSVICPGYGRVGQVRYRVGDSMSPGETMLKILHTDRRFVTVQIPTAEIDRVQPGDSVELVFPDDQVYTGQVTDLPMIAEISSSGQSLASVRIEHTGRLWSEVPIGSQVEVRIR